MEPRAPVAANSCPPTSLAEPVADVRGVYVFILLPRVPPQLLAVRRKSIGNEDL